MKNKYAKIYAPNGVYEDFRRECISGKEFKFRHCKATVGFTDSGEYTYLRSYDTIVCVIDNITGEAVDILRTEYGYTATSCQHISKFLRDYPHTKLFMTGVDNKGQYYQRIY